MPSINTVGSLPLPSSYNFMGREIIRNDNGYFYRDSCQNLNREELDQLFAEFQGINFRNILSDSTSLLQEQSLPLSQNYFNSSVQYYSHNAPPIFSAHQFTSVIQDELQVVPMPVVTPKFPIGSIVKWDCNIPGVRNYIIQLEKQSNPLIKICSLHENGEIRSFIWFGECDIIEQTYDIKYFCETTIKEKENFLREFIVLKTCQTYPEIGTVIKYLGNEKSNKGSRATVTQHGRDGTILVRWISGRNLGTIGIYPFTVWQISRNQQGGFVPVLTDYCQCGNCASTRLRSTSRQVDDKLYCNNDCAKEAGNDACLCCGSWSRKEALFMDVRALGACNRCFIKYYRACSECDDIYNYTHMSRVGDGNFRCHDCNKFATTLVHSYDYKPSPLFNKMAWENTRYLGIELEIEGFSHEEEDHKGMARMIKTWLKQQASLNPLNKKIEKSVYIKNDGSLEDGMEIVFQPFTLKALHSYFQINKFIQFLNEHDAEVSERCGMHVHVSKEKISTASLLRGRWFFYKCMPFLKKFSERRSFQYCEFEPKPPYKDPMRQDFGRRSALNLAASQKTLEIRIFQSTLDYKKFMANVQFADAFVAYIQHGVSSNFLITHTPNQCWIDFIDWAKRDGRYQMMTNWILQKGIV